MLPPDTALSPEEALAQLQSLTNWRKEKSPRGVKQLVADNPGGINFRKVSQALGIGLGLRTGGSEGDQIVVEGGRDIQILRELLNSDVLPKKTQFARG